MLTVARLQKSFATPEGPVKVVDDVGFEIAEGQCHALLGPSGCGKTTILRCIAGLEQPDAGTIAISGRTVCDPARGVFVPVHQRPIGMVFQSYAIWPHFDVFVNVAYPLQVQRPRLARDEIEARVMEVLRLVGMESMARRPATRLSGGQQQRDALARAIVRRPALLLLDEPLSNLDARLRETMRKELSELIGRIGITALLVTHDQAEAFAMAQRLAIMDHGRIIQEGTAREVYAHPGNAFIARFLGAANVLKATVLRPGVGASVRLDGSGQTIEVATDLPHGTAVEVILRPESLSIDTDLVTTSGRALRGQVSSVTFQGDSVDYAVEIGGGTLRVIGRPDREIVRGAAVIVTWDVGTCTVFRSR
jgi:iron(III) transport system ATP-binding protein